MLRVVMGGSCCNAAFDILAQSRGGTTGFVPSINCRNALLRHQYSSSAFSFSPIRVAIVGAGPAGFYTAKYLLRDTAQLEKFGNEGGVHIDILDRLPTPYGLVRSGVAPDHPEVKNVQAQFSEIAEHPRVNFRGNVEVGATSGTGLSLSDLMRAYHCVVLAYGAESRKELTIPGAHLRGVIPARDFVGWYNGHPDFVHLSKIIAERLSNSNCCVAVIGNGNVALDCARILAKGGSTLAHTDCATHALEVLTPRLSPSSCRRIWVLGRRGHAQASFTIKELREMTRIPTSHLVVRDDELQAGRGKESSSALQERPRQRIEKVLNEAAAIASRNISYSDADSNKTEVSLRFLVSPVRVLSDGEGSVSGLDIERNQLVSDEEGAVVARGTGELEHFPCSLVLVSIGYKTLPLHGLPFDHKRGIICNEHGRVQALRGVYCSGWAKRGPTGIIATNILDAKDTVKSIVDDLQGDLLQDLRAIKPGWNGLQDTVRSAAIGWEQYKRIDKAEVALGASCGKPRKKIVFRSELLRTARGEGDC